MKFLACSLLVSAGAAVAQVRHPTRQIDSYLRRTLDDRRSATFKPPQASPAATISFSNPKAQQFYVDGSTIPEVDFNAGPSWSGEHIQALKGLIPFTCSPLGIYRFNAHLGKRQ
jgi:hypothetical protein